MSLLFLAKTNCDKTFSVLFIKSNKRYSTGISFQINNRSHIVDIVFFAPPELRMIFRCTENKKENENCSGG